MEDYHLSRLFESIWLNIEDMVSSEIQALIENYDYDKSLELNEEEWEWIESKVFELLGEGSKALSNKTHEDLLIEYYQSLLGVENGGD